MKKIGMHGGWTIVQRGTKNVSFDVVWGDGRIGRLPKKAPYKTVEEAHAFIDRRNATLAEIMADPRLD